MKKVISIFFTMLMVASITVIFAAAKPSDPSKIATCTISSNSNVGVSSAVFGTHKYFGGENKKSSSKKLSISSQYFSTGSNKYVFDVRKHLDPNTSLGDTATRTFSDKVNWRVHLTPYGVWMSGCNGSGYIWYK